MLAADLHARLALLPALSGRVKTAAELAQVNTNKQWPQGPLAAFVLPLGLQNLPNGQQRETGGDASAGAFTQMVDQLMGVLLFLRSSGDPTGARSLPSLDELIWQVVGQVCGWVPAEQIGPFRLVKGELLQAEAGVLLYQLDFAVSDQIRILS